MELAGLSPMEALVAATGDADPAVIELVLKEGRAVKDRLGSAAVV